MINWGYRISQPRAIQLDKADMEPARRILEAMPELEACIGCGGCAATCTAGALTEFNLRMVQTLVRRGEYQGAWEAMGRCMLCGKCKLVCPRGLNTRALVLLIKKELGEF